MSATYLAGIDLGTSSAKTVIIDSRGRMQAVATRAYDVDTPRPGWAEQHPGIWYGAALETLREALIKSAVPPRSIAAIGVSGLMHGTVILGQDGHPVRPAIIWADQRSLAQVQEVNLKLGIEKLGNWTCNPVATGFMLPTWLWLRENEPETTQLARWILLPKDYLRFRMTGEIGSEPSDASSTLLFNTAERTWSTPLLDEFQLNPNLLPEIAESAAIAGGLVREVAVETGLLSGTPVVFGGSDQACQAIAQGVIDPGMMSCTIGTGGQILAPLAEPDFDPKLRLHLFCHALPERWHLEAATLSAGLSLKWLRDHLLEGSSYQVLADSASTVSPGAEGLFFLPYLLGERTPHMDPRASGALIGLAFHHQREHIVRAVMEGVVYALRQGLELIRMMGISPYRVIASGGATNHPLWLQLQADIFNIPIYLTRTIEAAATGAALLASVGAGIYPDIPAACQQTVQMDERIYFPEPGRAGMYSKYFDAYCQLYPALRVLREE
jgi:xylulokinase